MARGGDWVLKARYAEIAVILGSGDWKKMCRMIGFAVWRAAQTPTPYAPVMLGGELVKIFCCRVGEYLSSFYLNSK